MPTLDCPPHLRVAVIGVGYLGQYHAEKYARMEAVELVGVVDINADRAADGIYDEWIRKSFERLAGLMPARYAKKERSEDVVTTLY